MQVTISDTISEKVKDLPLLDQKEVLDIVEQKITQVRARKEKPFLERVIEISSQVSDEEWAKLPTDGSVNHDHHLYGAPKRY